MTPTRDEIEIVRMTGILNASVESHVAQLSSALFRHGEETSDPGAQLSTRPLDDLAAASMADAIGKVSGYRPIRFSDMYEKTEADIDQLIAASLTKAPLSNVTWEAVWALGKVVVVYVSGDFV